MRKIVLFSLVVCLLGLRFGDAHAAAMQKQSFAYARRAGAPSRLTSLDVYWQQEGTRKPVMVYVHGGSWRGGDKRAVHRMPAAFLARGYVFVSVNYRLSPRFRHPAHRDDVAAALGWVAKNAARFGGDGRRLFLMGHSSGAHIAAMAAVKTPGRVKAVISLDSPIFDIPAGVKMRGGITRDQRPAFGSKPALWKDASPAYHVGGAPPFLLFYTGNRVFSAQSKAFAGRLRKAGRPVEIHFTRDGHMALESGIGRRGDKETAMIWRFLKRYGG